MSMKPVLSSLFPFVAAAAFFVISGCESDDSGSKAVTITPHTATLNPGGSVSLTVSGATGACTWSLSSKAAGRLSASTGSSVVYTAIRAGHTQVVSARDAASNAIIAQAFINQPGKVSSSSSASGATSSSPTGSSSNTTASATSSRGPARGKLAWGKAPPAHLAIGQSVNVIVTGASDISKLVWKASGGTTNAVVILTETKGTDTVVLRGEKAGRSTITVEDLGAKGEKSVLRHDIEVP